ncbi:hypothetical protein DXG01_001826, partial [Tephrocybe rancida]
HPVTPTIEECDQEDKADMIQEIEGPVKPAGSMKGMQHARSTEMDGYTSGLLPQVAIETALALQAKYHKDLKILADEYHKPVTLFHQKLGETLKKPCRMNVWNAFAYHYACHSAINNVLTPHMVTSEEWVGIISAAYHKQLEELGDMMENMVAKHEHFKEYLNWYAQNLNTYVDKLHQDGNFRALLGQILDPFVKMSLQAYEQYNIHMTAS